MERTPITYKRFKTHNYDDIYEELTFLQNKEELKKFFINHFFKENAYEEILKFFDKINSRIYYKIKINLFLITSIYNF
jgi:hypothetical protein